jgi:dTDP-glucose pyrophosphorylase
VGFREDKLQEVMAEPAEPLARVLPRMDAAGLQVMLVVDARRRLLGIVTDGDVRRALLRGETLNAPVSRIMHPQPKVLPVGTPLQAAREMMLAYSIRHVPLVDEEDRVVDLLLWVDLFGLKRPARPEPVVIMAGGKGARLDPFTKILPKPMLPLGDKPIVEVIMDRLYDQGFDRFILTLGYKAEVVRLYFAEGNGRPYQVEFVQEADPLGTAGALGLVRQKLEGTFVVTNCDVILEMDYSSLLRYHADRRHQVTVVGSLRDFTVPYGVLQIEGEELSGIEEKPSFHFLVNAGVYVLEPAALELVTPGVPLDMPELILRAKHHGLKVGVFPHHGRWFDVGQWEEYRQTLKALDFSG